ncbi:MAG: hypothetical protein EBU90_18645 [Proteobacteria bacterium]|nr:hypothetical protein [Pseudomonadota bacterium]NBP16888.1 hypothetical protein [bacterium]
MNIDYSCLNKNQQKILDTIKSIYKEETDLFMSTPNKYFRGRPPIEMLLSKDYSYFNPFITKK